MTISPEQFKSALGLWPSGVSIVTSYSNAGPAGMTVSALFSVSMTPPLIGVSLERSSSTLSVIEVSRHFGVNVLSVNQSSLSTRFAQEDEAVRFQDLALHDVPGARSPLLAGALVHLDCAVEATHDAGDHVLCIGRIRLAFCHPGEPLTFHRSRYHGLTALRR